MRRAGIAVYVHFVWATWDRLPLLTEEIERQIHRAIAAKCADLGAEVIALGGVTDHVHVLVGLPATITLADFVGKVKGASSHLATHRELPDGAFFKWQGSYGAASVSPGLLDVVSAYVAHQKEHHADNTLNPEWEHIPEFKPAQAGFVAERERGP